MTKTSTAAQIAKSLDQTLIAMERIIRKAGGSATIEQVTAKMPRTYPAELVTEAIEWYAERGGAVVEDGRITLPAK